MAGNYFVLPNEIFSLDLSANAIAVYAYLMRLEDRKTHSCWAKQMTIGKAVGIKSEKTVADALKELEEKELIYRESMPMEHNGKTVNGIQKFTIRPIDDAVQHKQWKQFDSIGRVAGDLRGRVFALVLGLPFQDLVPAEHPQVEALRKEIAQGLLDDVTVARGDDVALEFVGAVQHQTVAVQPDGRAVVEPGLHGGRRELLRQNIQDALPDIMD